VESEQKAFCNKTAMNFSAEPVRDRKGYTDLSTSITHDVLYSPDMIYKTGNTAEILPWEQIYSQVVLNIPPWLKVHEDSIRLPGGRVIKDYYRVETPDYVIMAVCDAEGRFLLERQYKHGVGAIILTSPSGGIDNGEIPLEAAKRELLEETGISANCWISAGKFLVDGTRGICTTHFFLVRELSWVAKPQHSDIETCDLVFLTRGELADAVQDGRICLLADVALYALVLGPLFKGLQKEP
jgi:ADP-ribose pyrophosphatase